MSCAIFFQSVGIWLSIGFLVHGKTIFFKLLSLRTENIRESNTPHDRIQKGFRFQTTPSLSRTKKNCILVMDL